MCVPSFNLPGLTVSEKTPTKFLMHENWRERRMKKKTKGWIRAAAWFWYTPYIPPLSICVPSFNLLGLTVPEKNVTKCLIFENWKGWISSSILISVYTIQRLYYNHPLFMFIWSFNLLGLTVSMKIGEKEEWKKTKGWIRAAAWFWYIPYIPPIVHMCTMFQPSRPYSSWEKSDEKFQCLKIGEKEKWRNKETNKQQQPDSSIYDISAQCVPIFNLLGLAVPEKVWRKILMFENWRERK